MESNEAPKTDLQNEIEKQIGDLSEKKEVNKAPVVKNIPIDQSQTQKRPIIPQPPEDQSNIINPNQTTTKSEEPVETYDIPTVRTYKADINQTVQGEKISSAKILMAEQKRREKQEKIENKDSLAKPTNKFKLGISVVLIALAVVAILYGTYLFLEPQPEVNVNVVADSSSDLMRIDENQFVDNTNQTKEDFFKEFENFKDFSFTENTIKELVIVKRVLEGDQEVSKKISIAELFILFEFNPPFVFSRTLTDDYILGAYRINNINKPFLLIKLNNFENAFDSAFDYEPTIIFDFKEIFDGFSEFDQIDQLRERKTELQKAQEEAGATNVEENLNLETQEVVVNEQITEESATNVSEATSVEENVEDTRTPEEVIDEAISELESKTDSYKNFVDIILQNSDSRAVVGDNSEVLFFYTFIDRQWILFANDSEVLKEIKRRIREKI